MNISSQIPDNIKRVSRSIGYALWLDTYDDWAGLSVILRARLSDKQRASLAFMVMRSLDCEQMGAVANAVMPQGTPAPMAPFINHVDEAAFWADMAEPEALDAYCLASFNAMTSSRQTAFLEFIQGRKAA